MKFQCQGVNWKNISLAYCPCIVKEKNGRYQGFVFIDIISFILLFLTLLFSCLILTNFIILSIVCKVIDWPFSKLGKYKHVTATRPAVNVNQTRLLMSCLWWFWALAFLCLAHKMFRDVGSMCVFVLILAPRSSVFLYFVFVFGFRLVFLT